MKILTIGDSWTYGSESTDPLIKSWPAQLSQIYNVEVVNLARPGSSNQRASRIGIEEICRNSQDYDYMIWPLGPASRTEILNMGKWHQIWPNLDRDILDKILTDFWHPWNDVQNTIMLCFYFFHSIKSMGIPCYATSLSLRSGQYKKEISWLKNYQDDFDFDSINIPNEITSKISTNDLDRKLRSLRSIHQSNLLLQPEYLDDQLSNWMLDVGIQLKYGFRWPLIHQNHPDDAGYSALAHFFASKIGLT